MSTRLACWLSIVALALCACRVESRATGSSMTRPEIDAVAERDMEEQGAGSTVAQAGQQEQSNSADRDDEDKEDRPLTEKIRIGKHLFELEVAADSESRARGLSDRAELAEDEGMIFVYPTGTRTRSFWMKNCLIDIDVIFLNPRGRVVAMHEMKAEEPRGKDESLLAYEDRLKLYSSRRPAQYAVELQAGMIRKLEIELGDEFLFDRAKLAKLARDNEKKEREAARGGRF